MGAFRNLYECFMLNLAKSRAALHKLRNNAQMEALLRSCCDADPTGFHVDLGSLLSAPINRIPQLQVDLEDLRRITPETDIDFGALSAVSDSFSMLKEALSIER